MNDKFHLSFLKTNIFSYLKEKKLRKKYIINKSLPRGAKCVIILV